MDAKNKIAEMLRQKREANGSAQQTVARSTEQRATQATTPPPTVVNHSNNNKAVKNGAENSHVSSIDRINAMLRQRQHVTPPTPITQQAQSINPAPTNNTVPEQIVIEMEKIDRCQICLGRLIPQSGIFKCDKCPAKFIKQINSNEFININELPFGICDCCEQRAPLIKLPGAIFPQCSTSKETYIPTAGRAVRLKMLPFGLCRCCNKPEILMATQDQSIRCPASGTDYVRNFDGSIVVKPPVVDMPNNANDIEAALNDGNAAFYYGGFIGGESENPRRRRRR